MLDLSLLKKDITFETFIELLRGLGFKQARKLYALQFAIDKRQEFYGDLSSILRSGVRLEVALVDMRHAKSVPDYVMRHLIAQVRRGKPLSSALAGIIPDQERMVIRSGEEGADRKGLESSLKILADSIGMMKSGKSAVIKATAYPAIILIGVIAFVVFYAKKMLPNFSSQNMIDVTRLKGNALFEYNFFIFISNFWYLIPIVAVLGVWWVTWSLSHEFPFREKLDMLPPWNIYRLWVGTQFLFSLAALMRAGVPALAAVSILQRSANPWLSKRLRYVRAGLAKGLTLSRSLEKSPYEFPERQIIARLRIREDHSDVAEALREFSLDWQDRGGAMIASRTAALNAVLMILASIIMTIAGVGPYAFESQSGSMGF